MRNALRRTRFQVVSARFSEYTSKRELTFQVPSLKAGRRSIRRSLHGTPAISQARTFTASARTESLCDASNQTAPSSTEAPCQLWKNGGRDDKCRY